MAYTLEQISAKLEIQDLLYRYAELIDAKAFDQLNEVFTDDAYIDYTALGGEKGNLTETIDFLTRALTDAFPTHQHLNANLQINLTTDTNITEASGRIMCFNPMETAMEGESNKLMMCGLWYLDDYVNIDGIWKIQRRIEEKSWVKII
tara:strand:- start:399 stop:842 length:444 start_codon:yes stop_codon:yes gene_type:complete